MIKLAIVSLSVATLAAALVGCDNPNELTGRQNVPKPGEEGSLTPEALQCTEQTGGPLVRPLRRDEARTGTP